MEQYAQPFVVLEDSWSSGVQDSRHLLQTAGKWTCGAFGCQQCCLYHHQGLDLSVELHKTDSVQGTGRNAF